MLKCYSDRIINVIFWGFKDDYLWLLKDRNNWLLFFDINYQVKYNYWVIVELLVLLFVINKGYVNNVLVVIDGVMDREYKGSIFIEIRDI